MYAYVGDRKLNLWLIFLVFSYSNGYKPLVQFITTQGPSTSEYQVTSENIEVPTPPSPSTLVAALTPRKKAMNVVVSNVQPVKHNINPSRPNDFASIVFGFLRQLLNVQINFVF